MPLLDDTEEEEEDEEEDEVEDEEEGKVIPPTDEEKSLMMKAFTNMSSTSNDVLPNTVLTDKPGSVIKRKSRMGMLPYPYRSLCKLADDNELNRNSEHLGAQWQSACNFQP